MNVSRTEALNLSTAAYEMGADILRGQLERAAGDGAWVIGETDLAEWLQKYEDQEVLIIVAPVGAKSNARQVCGTCGAEYSGNQCPRCREVRQRLRGRT